MSFFGFSDSRNSSCATISDAIWSSTSPVTKTIRSRSRREKMSKLRSPRLVCSTTTGTRAASGSIIGISSFIIGGALPRTGGLAPPLPYIGAKVKCFKGAKRVQQFGKGTSMPAAMATAKTDDHLDRKSDGEGKGGAGGGETG